MTAARWWLGARSRIFVCPWCRGEGGDYVPVLYHGTGGGPFEVCGLCQGTGAVRPWRRWLPVWWRLRGRS